MNLPETAVPQFMQFMVEMYGVEWVDTKGGSSGELARTMLKDRLLVIRKHEMRRSAEAVEVFCSDRALVKEIEQEFYGLVEGQEADTSGVDVPEEGTGKEG